MTHLEIIVKDGKEVHRINVIPTMMDFRFVDLQMYLPEEHELVLDYKDVVLLRDYLTSLIDLHKETKK